MKLNQVKNEVVEAASAAALQTALAAFLDAGGERLLVAVHYQVDAGVYSALVLYTT